MRTPRAVVAVGITAITIATTLATSAAGGAPTGPATDHIALNKTFDLGALGQTVNGDTKDFAGLYVDETNHTVTVYTASGSAVAKARTALTSQHNASPALFAHYDARLTQTTSYQVTYVAVKHSQQAMVAASDAITADTMIDGVRWNVVGPSPRSNQVLIGVTEPTAKLAAHVKARYGDLVRVVKQAPFTEDVKVTKFPTAAAADAYVHANASKRTVTPNDSAGSYSRYNDVSPFFGGDRIDTFTNDHTAVVSCTGGFPYTDPYYAPPQMLFAGHCGPSNYWWWNATAANGWTGHFMGITGWQTFNSGQTDAGLITAQNGATMDPDIYVRDSTYWPTAGGAYNNAGNQFCSDGSYTQERCTGQIDRCGQKIDAWVDTGNGGYWSTSYDMCIGYSVGGDYPLSQAGDSGGPIISGSPLMVRGIISSGDGIRTINFTPWEAVNRLVGGHPCPC